MNLLKYIQGLRKGKEAHRIEKEAMKDPFLSEALEGYDKVSGDHGEIIRSLQEQIAGKSRNNKQSLFKWSAVAAVLLIGVFIGGKLFITPVSDELLSLSDISTEADSFVPAETKPVIPPQTEDLFAIQREVKQKQTTPKEVRTEKSSPKAEPPVPAPDLLAVITPPEAEEMMDLHMEDAEEPVVKEINPHQEEVLAENKSQRNDLKYFGAKPKTPSVRGIVTDTSGEPLPGALVSVEGTGKNSITDLDGQFYLDASVGDEIRIEYIGFDELRLPVIDTSGRTLMIALHEDSNTFDEVVVMGSSARKKESKRKQGERPSSISHVKIPVPVPVNGEKAYQDYLKNSLIKPTDEACKKVKGKVTIAFKVNDTGRPYDIRIKKGICESVDREAERLVREGPDWIPAEGEAEITVKF